MDRRNRLRRRQRRRTFQCHGPPDCRGCRRYRPLSAGRIRPSQGRRYRFGHLAEAGAVDSVLDEGRVLAVVGEREATEAQRDRPLSVERGADCRRGNRDSSVELDYRKVGNGSVEVLDRCGRAVPRDLRWCLSPRRTGGREIHIAGDSREDRRTAPEVRELPVRVIERSDAAEAVGGCQEVSRRHKRPRTGLAALVALIVHERRHEAAGARHWRRGEKKRAVDLAAGDKFLSGSRIGLHEGTEIVAGWHGRARGTRGPVPVGLPPSSPPAGAGLRLSPGGRSSDARRPGAMPISLSSAFGPGNSTVFVLSPT